MVIGTLAPQRREQILRTAAEEFASMGYQRASLNRIIRVCAMSKGSFYHYFDSKAALFDAVVGEAMDALGRDLCAPATSGLDGPQFWQTLGNLAARILDLTAGEEWYAHAARLFYLPDTPLADSPAMRGALAAINAWMREALTVGRTSGAVRTDLPVALQARLVTDLVRSLDRWSLEHLRDNDTTPSETAAILLDLLRRVLAPDRGRERRPTP